ncbi:hypothetical protein PHO31112_01216 [Pandoraea horticolens]|uniref:Uncharacterized protein n=1 Tax=Pandoraea horticolens TaxID=2508298 RepID=A0A5E4T6L0_9BURK|nr:hypothetical protein PHO31112_01216 [Pandoraea horticolens]
MRSAVTENGVRQNILGRSDGKRVLWRGRNASAGLPGCHGRVIALCGLSERERQSEPLCHARSLNVHYNAVHDFRHANADAAGWPLSGVHGASFWAATRDVPSWPSCRALSCAREISYAQTSSPTLSSRRRGGDASMTRHAALWRDDRAGCGRRKRRMPRPRTSQTLPAQERRRRCAGCAGRAWTTGSP